MRHFLVQATQPETMLACMHQQSCNLSLSHVTLARKARSVAWLPDSRTRGSPDRKPAASYRIPGSSICARCEPTARFHHLPNLQQRFSGLFFGNLALSMMIPVGELKRFGTFEGLGRGGFASAGRVPDAGQREPKWSGECGAAATPSGVGRVGHPSVS